MLIYPFATPALLPQAFITYQIRNMLIYRLWSFWSISSSFWDISNKEYEGIRRRASRGFPPFKPRCSWISSTCEDWSVSVNSCESAPIPFTDMSLSPTITFCSGFWPFHSESKLSGLILSTERPDPLCDTTMPQLRPADARRLTQKRLPWIITRTQGERIWCEGWQIWWYSQSSRHYWCWVHEDDVDLVATPKEYGRGCLPKLDCSVLVYMVAAEDKCRQILLRNVLQL